MQSVHDYPVRPNLQQFAGGRNYMMRSEKRRGASTSGGANGKRPVRRPRRRRAGFLYKLFTILLLVILWPAGLVMLWRRKLRWGLGTKLLTSVVTLMACIIIFGFALTVQTDNAQYTAIQDSVNSFLDKAADSLVVAADTIADKAVEAGDAAANLGSAIWTRGGALLANGIDDGVQIAENVRAGVTGMLRSGEPDPTVVAGESEAPTDAPTKAATDAPSDAPSAPASIEATDAATEAAAGPATEEPTEAVTSAPTSEPTPKASDAPTAEPTEEPTPEPTEFPGYAVTPAQAGTVYMPEIQPAAGTQLRSGTLKRSGILAEGTVELPDTTPVFSVKYAKDATVYYNANGRFYHMASTCTGMSSAQPHTLADAIADGMGMCANCASPNPEILGAKYAVWTDENNIAHLSDTCPAFSGMWTLIDAEAALQNEVLGCPECEADAFLAAVAAGTEFVAEPILAEIPTEAPTVEPTEEPTEEPTAEPTVEPTAEPTTEPTVEPTVKPTAEPTVEPTVKPTVVPTPEPTVKPTAEPTVEPTQVPTPKPTQVPTPEPTQVPTPEPTTVPEPTTGVITPTVALKPAGLATVYHTSNGSWYHMATTCTNMYGASPYALQDCVDETGKVFKSCRTCSAPVPELIDLFCLWMDEESIYHTTDECIGFTGRYTLVPRDEAVLEEAPVSCPHCGSQQYLIPGTHIAYIPYVAPTLAPENL